MTDRLDPARLPRELVWLLGVVAGRVAPARDLDVPLLLKLVRHHRLAPHLDAALEATADLPELLRHGLETARRRARLRGLWHSGELAGLAAGLSARGIDVMALKGPAMALLLHGDASRRDCHDLDLLVRPEQAAAALEALEARGFVLPSRGSAFHPGTTDHDLPLRHRGTGLIVEMHVRLVPEQRLFPLDPWGAATTVTLAGTPLRTLVPSAALVFAAAHGCRHLWNRLGWLTDIAAAVRSPEIDWDETCALAMRLGADRPLALAAVLARDLLGAVPPPALTVARPLARAAASAAVLAPAFTAPPVTDREAIYRIGPLRVMLWEASQFHGIARWVALRRHFRVPDSDRRAVPLPRWLEPLRPALRMLRIGGRLMRQKSAGCLAPGVSLSRRGNE